MAVMQQMPAGLVSPPASEAVLPTSQADGAFAGLLQGMSKHKIVQTILTGHAAPLKQSGMTNDVMSALFTAAGNNENQAVIEQNDSTEGTANTSLPQDSHESEPQNVIPDAKDAQLAQLLAPFNGRMPETESIADGRSEGLLEISQVALNTTSQLGSTDLAQNRSDAPTQQNAITPVTVGSIDRMSPAVDTTVSTNTNIVGVLDETEASQLGSATGIRIPETSKNKPEATEGDKTAVPNKLTEPRTSLISAFSEVRGMRQPEVSLDPTGDSTRVVTGLPQQLTLNPEAAKGSFSVTTDPFLQSKAVVQEVAKTENSLPQPESQAVQSRMSVLPANSAAATLLQVSMQENELIEAPVLQPVMGSTPEQPQRGRSAGEMASLTAVAANAAAGQLETGPVRIDQIEAGKSTQCQIVDTAKKVVTSPSEEAQTNGEEQKTADRGLNGNFQAHVLHQQVKTEGALTASSVIGTAQNEISRPDLPTEQVVQQVRDRLVNHETKPGSEQIVLRLSPEHLGELKVNLNLEGQRLKVEIVAENRMVRDSLMQHTDALKESLSRLNIKMESFEVTTGGNGSADSGRSQGDWRELAQQRQHNTWMPNGGYRLAGQAPPALAAYQIKSEHKMVDLHF